MRLAITMCAAIWLSQHGHPYLGWLAVLAWAGAALVAFVDDMQQRPKLMAKARLR